MNVFEYKPDTWKEKSFKFLASSKYFLNIVIFIALVLLGIYLYDKQFLYAFNIYLIILGCLQIAFLFEIYKIFKFDKNKVMKIGRSYINTPLYFDYLKRKIERLKSEQDRIGKFDDIQKELVELSKEIKDYKSFQRKILPILNKHKDNIYLYMLSRAFLSYDITEAHNYLNEQIDRVKTEHKLTDEDIQRIGMRKSTSRYLVYRNELLRIIDRNVRRRLDSKYDKKLKDLEQLLEQNPEMEKFINDMLVEVKREDEERTDRKEEDLAHELIFLYEQYKNKE